MTDPEPCPYRTCAIPKPEHEVREFGPYTVFYPPGGGFPHGIVETVPPPAPVAPTSHREAMRATRERAKMAENPTTRALPPEDVS